VCMRCEVCVCWGGGALSVHFAVQKHSCSSARFASCGPIRCCSGGSRTTARCAQRREHSHATAPFGRSTAFSVSHSTEQCTKRSEAQVRLSRSPPLCTGGAVGGLFACGGSTTDKAVRYHSAVEQIDKSDPVTDSVSTLSPHAYRRQQTHTTLPLR
jgi:hypothetical protein